MKGEKWQKENLANSTKYRASFIGGFFIAP